MVRTAAVDRGKIWFVDVDDVRPVQKHMELDVLSLGLVMEGGHRVGVGALSGPQQAQENGLVTTRIHGFAKSSRLCRESNKKLSAKKALPRAKRKTPANQSGFFAESLLKNSQQRNKHSAQISLPRAK
jgi:hypothetical protein